MLYLAKLTLKYEGHRQTIMSTDDSETYVLEGSWANDLQIVEVTEWYKHKDWLRFNDS